jgi:hypothetical protein
MSNNVQKILIDNVLDQKLLQEGYVIVPFLDEATVKDLKYFYFEHHHEVIEGMYATAHVSDISFRIKMNDFIKTKFQKSIKEYFQNCTPLGGSYIVKGKGEKGAINPHQDWNIVDENLYRSFNIWIPLVNLHDNNGAIQIEPGSHLWGPNYRSANISFEYSEREESLWKSMPRLYMKAGEALIYDHRLIHASDNNYTDELRMACVFGIIPNGAQMYYYHKNEDQDIEVYESNPEFFLHGNIFEGPKGLKRIKIIKKNYTNSILKYIKNFFS